MGFLFVVALSIPYSPGIRHYPVEIPESLAQTSLTGQGTLAKAWVEETALKVGGIDVFLALGPRTSYLLPKIEDSSPKLYYLGETHGDTIIYAVWEDSWWRAYNAVDITLDPERETLNVLVASDWRDFLVTGILAGVVLGLFLGLAIWALLDP